MLGSTILPSTVHIYQHQDSGSNWTEAIIWLKGGQSQASCNPSIAQHNTGGSEGTGAITILPYATEGFPWNGDLGLYVAKNQLQIEGKVIYPLEIRTSQPSNRTIWVNVGTRV